MLPTIAQHAKHHDIRPNKRLGQNFLYDLSLCNKIAEQAGDITNKTVIEIGPGVGGLTRAILNRSPKNLIVIEKDTRCLALLEDLKNHYPHLTIINADALECDLDSLALASEAREFNIISNLPYNIGTNLVVNWLRHSKNLASITVMLQKEVVERICAKAGDKNYGRLSVWCNLLSTPSTCFDVSPQAFYPPPKIFSSVVHLKLKAQNLDKALQEILSKILITAFSARRKIIKKALANLVNEAELSALSLPPTMRADQITPEQFVELARYIKARDSRD